MANDNNVTVETPVVDSPVVETVPAENTVETVPISAVPPSGDTPPIDAETPVVEADYYGFDEKQEKRFNEERAELVSMGGNLYAGDFKSHLRYGKKLWGHIYTAKTAMDTKRSKLGRGEEFKDTDHDRLCTKIAELAEMKFAIGRDGKKRSDVRCIDDIRAYKWVEYATPICGTDDIQTLPWSVVSLYLVPKTLAYNKKTMAGQIRLDWVDFVKEWVAAYKDFGKEGTTYAGETNFRGILAQAIKDHEQALKDARDGKKTVEQLDAAAKAKKSQEAKKIKDKASTALSTALSNALAGPLTPQEVADIVTVVTKDMNVELPLTKTAASLMDVNEIVQLLGAVATKDDAGRFCKTLFAANKIDVLTMLSQYSARLVEASAPELAAVA